MTQSTRTPLVSLLAFLLVMAALAPGRARADVQTDVQAELEKARQLSSARDNRGACKAYQRANELAQGKSSASLIGLSYCFTELKEWAKAMEMARQARAVAATPEEQAKATERLGYALLQQPDEASWTEAASLFKGQVDSSGGAKGQGGLLSALLALHRDQEAAEILQSLRKQGMTEDQIQQEVLSHVVHPGSEEDTQRIDDFNERLLRLDPNAPLRAGGKITRPQILRTVKPETPWEARQHHGFNGTVILEAVIDTQGNVSSVRVLKEQPYGLSESAVKSVKKWKFKPATLEGKPVTVYYVLTVNFQIGR